MIRKSVYSALFTLLVCALSGCIPAEEGPVNELQDPHYQRGRSLVGTLDYRGAADEFERAIQNNPRAAAAHFDLGCLYEEQFKEYDTAIYHYRRHLALETNSPHLAQATDHIRVCRRELANVEFPLPATQKLQHQLEQLTQTNAFLKQQFELTKTQLEDATNALKEARSDAESNAAALAQARAAVQASAAALAQARQAASSARNYGYTGAGAASAQPANASLGTIAVASPSGRPHTYVIKSGDSIASVAQQFGLNYLTVQAANPKVNPKHLRVGQTINLP